MKGIDGGYKLTELLFGREDSADVNVTAGSRKTLKQKFIFQIGTESEHSTNVGESLVCINYKLQIL